MSQVAIQDLERTCRSLLVAIGEDPDREGLRDTPRRFARMWREFIEYEPGSVDTTFAHSPGSQMIVIAGMRVWSVCEHHLVPFWCRVSVGYIPGDRVLGLSKFARIAHKVAHRLQLQERIVADIADHVSEVSGSKDVAVLAQGEHLCMSMRGIKTEALMTSSVVRGVFMTKADARAEFFSLCAQRGGGA